MWRNPFVYWWSSEVSRSSDSIVHEYGGGMKLFLLPTSLGSGSTRSASFFFWSSDHEYITSPFCSFSRFENLKLRFKHKHRDQFNKRLCSQSQFYLGSWPANARTPSTASCSLPLLSRSAALDACFLVRECTCMFCFVPNNRSHTSHRYGRIPRCTTSSCLRRCSFLPKLAPQRQENRRGREPDVRRRPIHGLRRGTEAKVSLWTDNRRLIGLSTRIVLRDISLHEGDPTIIFGSSSLDVEFEGRLVVELSIEEILMDKSITGCCEHFWVVLFVWFRLGVTSQEFNRKETVNLLWTMIEPRFDLEKKVGNFRGCPGGEFNCKDEGENWIE